MTRFESDTVPRHLATKETQKSSVAHGIYNKPFIKLVLNAVIEKVS